MIFEVLTNPHATLESAANQRRVWSAAGVVGLWALLNLVLTALLVFGGDLREQFAGLSPAVLEQVVLTLRNLGPVAALLFPFVWWISVSALMLLAVRLFDGRTDYASLVAVVGVSCAPWVLGYAVQLPAGVLQLVLGDEGWLSSVLGAITFAVSMASLAAHVILVVYGAQIAAGTSYRGAAASCALTGLGCATAGFVLLISILTLVFVLSGAT
ncbi:MAG: YIP1 family protein [Rubrobacteraceae bacterium]